jgi:hypothetical protein
LEPASVVHWKSPIYLPEEEPASVVHWKSSISLPEETGGGGGRVVAKNIKINEEKREAREGRVNFPSAWRPAGMSRHNQPKKTAT